MKYLVAIKKYCRVKRAQTKFPSIFALKKILIVKKYNFDDKNILFIAKKSIKRINNISKIVMVIPDFNIE